MTDKSQELKQPSLCIGIDWADRFHECYVITADGQHKQMSLEQSPEAIHEWLAEMRELAQGGTIAIILEQSRGALIHALMHRENVVLYPINPKQLARYRESYSGGNGKNDVTDAMYLARMLSERIDILHPWLPDDEQTRLLNSLCQQRRLIVQQKNQLRQQLISTLKQYSPLLCQLFGKCHQLPLLLEIVQRWSDPKRLRRADRQLIAKVLGKYMRGQEKRELVIAQIRNAELLSHDDALIVPLAMKAEMLARQIKPCIDAIQEFDKKIEEVFRQHEDQHLFSSLRGAGPALAPRLLAAFGSQRDRWESADQLAAFSGVAPITRQSGKQCIVQRRVCCPKYLRQTFHEFADAARRWCPWTKAKYALLRERGMKHHAALRNLARSWIRILFRVWQTRQPFDYQTYVQNLKLRMPAIVPYLEQQENDQETCPTPC